MSRFFVGQRVRVIVAPAHPALVGAQARIVGLGVQHWGGRPLKGTDDCVLIVDGFGEPIGTETWAIEPILPEGMQPAKWEDCMWQPEGVAA